MCAIQWQNEISDQGRGQLYGGCKLEKLGSWTRKLQRWRLLNRGTEEEAKDILNLGSTAGQDICK